MRRIFIKNKVINNKITYGNTRTTTRNLNGMMIDNKIRVSWGNIKRKVLQ